MLWRTQTRTGAEISAGTIKWVSGALAGIVGTLAFGLLYQILGQTAVIAVAFPAMYDIQGPALGIGWGDSSVARSGARGGVRGCRLDWATSAVR